MHLHYRLYSRWLCRGACRQRNIDTRCPRDYARTGAAVINIKSKSALVLSAADRRPEERPWQ